MGVKERIVEYISYKKIPTSEFERKCNLSNGYISSIRNGFGVQKLENVLNTFSDLRRDWILYGEGEMLKSSDSPISQPQQSHEIRDNSTPQSFDNTLTTYLQAENKKLQTENKDLNKQIGRLEGKLESAYELINDLKKEIPAPDLFRAAVK